MNHCIAATRTPVRYSHHQLSHVLCDLPGEVIGAAGVSGSLGVNKTTGVTGALFPTSKTRSYVFLDITELLMLSDVKVCVIMNQALIHD